MSASFQFRPGDVRISGQPVVVTSGIVTANVSGGSVITASGSVTAINGPVYGGFDNILQPVSGVASLISTSGYGNVTPLSVIITDRFADVARIHEMQGAVIFASEADSLQTFTVPKLFDFGFNAPTGGVPANAFMIVSTSGGNSLQIATSGTTSVTVTSGLGTLADLRGDLFDAYSGTRINGQGRAQFISTSGFAVSSGYTPLAVTIVDQFALAGRVQQLAQAATFGGPNDNGILTYTVPKLYDFNAGKSTASGFMVCTMSGGNTLQIGTSGYNTVTITSGVGVLVSGQAVVIASGHYPASGIYHASGIGVQVNSGYGVIVQSGVIVASGLNVIPQSGVGVLISGQAVVLGSGHFPASGIFFASGIGVQINSGRGVIINSGVGVTLASGISSGMGVLINSGVGVTVNSGLNVVGSLTASSSGNYINSRINTDLEDSLVSRWRFDADVNDYVGVNHGVTSGNPTYLHGMDNFGIVMSGAQSVDIAHHPSLQQTSELTVGGWIKFVYTSGQQRIIHKLNLLAPLDGWGFDVISGDTPNDSLRFAVLNSGVASEARYSMTNFQPGVWYHVVGTFKGSGSNAFIAMAVSGVVVSSGVPNTNTIGIVNNSGRQVEFGKWGTAGYFNGMLDDWRLYNAAMVGTQFTSLYNTLRTQRFSVFTQSGDIVTINSGVGVALGSGLGGVSGQFVNGIISGTVATSVSGNFIVLNSGLVKLIGSSGLVVPADASGRLAVANGIYEPVSVTRNSGQVAPALIDSVGRLTVRVDTHSVMTPVDIQSVTSGVVIPTGGHTQVAAVSISGSSPSPYISTNSGGAAFSSGLCSRMIIQYNATQTVNGVVYVGASGMAVSGYGYAVYSGSVPLTLDITNMNKVYAFATLSGIVLSVIATQA